MLPPKPIRARLVPLSGFVNIRRICRIPMASRWFLPAVGKRSVTSSRPLNPPPGLTSTCGGQLAWKAAGLPTRPAV